MEKTTRGNEQSMYRLHTIFVFVDLSLRLWLLDSSQIVELTFALFFCTLIDLD
jgi:hypothetical protein